MPPSSIEKFQACTHGSGATALPQSGLGFAGARAQVPHRHLPHLPQRPRRVRRRRDALPRPGRARPHRVARARQGRALAQRAAVGRRQPGAARAARRPQGDARREVGVHAVGACGPVRRDLTAHPDPPPGQRRPPSHSSLRPARRTDKRGHAVRARTSNTLTSRIECVAGHACLPPSGARRRLHGRAEVEQIWVRPVRAITGHTCFIYSRKRKSVPALACERHGGKCPWTWRV